MLRHCLPASIRQTLDQLPKSLDDTYVRVLRQIPQANQAHAHRMLQCLMVAVRPLYVEELAELLAFEFDAAPGGIPTYRAAWRLDDQTQAVLSTCSSLVTIISEHRSGRSIVQFSHFSVKEFLISNRLGDFSQYYIRLVSAHTILTQACLGSLLHNIDEMSAKHLPLAQYAAQYWVEHARFKDVALHVKHGMEILFDSSRPHFVAWLGIYDMDHPSGLTGFHHLSHQSYSKTSSIPKPNPLYYAVLSGFYDLVKHLAIKDPQHINAICGQYRFPLFAALSKGHLEVVELLLEHGANVNALDATGETMLLKVLSQLISPPRSRFWYTHDPNRSFNVEYEPRYEHPLKIAQLLVRHNADVNVQFSNGKTLLHMLSGSLNDDEGIIHFALLLLKHGADVNRQDKDKQTALHLALGCGRFELAGILLRHCADPNAEDNMGKAPLYILLEQRIDCIGGVSNPNRLWSPGHSAESNKSPSMDAGASVENKTSEDLVHQPSQSHYVLRESGVGTQVSLPDLFMDATVTVSYVAQSNFDPVQMAQELVNHGANVNAEKKVQTRSLIQKRSSSQLWSGARINAGLVQTPLKSGPGRSSRPHRSEGECRIPWCGLGVIQWLLTRAWYRRALTKDEPALDPPVPVALSFVVQEARYRTGAT